MYLLIPDRIVVRPITKIILLVVPGHFVEFTMECAHGTAGVAVAVSRAMAGLKVLIFACDVCCVCVAARWEPRGGKSNSFFAKTRDDRFIVKQLSLAERKSFQEIAPKYFKHLADATRDKQPTCLAKIMGVFTVRAFSSLFEQWSCFCSCFVPGSLARTHPTSVSPACYSFASRQM